MGAVVDKQGATSDAPSSVGHAQSGEEPRREASERVRNEQSEALERLFRNCRIATDRTSRRASSIIGALVVVALMLAAFLWWQLLT